MELSQGPPPPQSSQSQPPVSHPSLSVSQAQSHEVKSKQMPGSVYHINLDQPPPSSSQSQSSAQKIQVQSNQPHKVHAQQITLEKLNERAYHMDKGQPPPNHLAEAMYRVPMLANGMPLQLPPQGQSVCVICSFD